VDIVIWQRIRALRSDIRTPVVREPESGWWEMQDRLDEATTTVVVLRAGEAAADVVVSRLAELAATDELMVVVGSAAGVQPGHRAMIADLRGRLPRQHVVAMHIEDPDMRRHAADIERFLDAGNLPVAVTPPAAIHGVAAEISNYVRADRVLRVLGTPAGGTLHQVWRRPPLASVN
jgi:hypothetical protein